MECSFDIKSSPVGMKTLEKRRAQACDLWTGEPLTGSDARAWLAIWVQKEETCCDVFRNILRIHRVVSKDLVEVVMPQGIVGITRTKQHIPGAKRSVYTIGRSYVLSGEKNAELAS